MFDGWFIRSKGPLTQLERSPLFMIPADAEVDWNDDDAFSFRFLQTHFDPLVSILIPFFFFKISSSVASDGMFLYNNNNNNQAN